MIFISKNTQKQKINKIIILKKKTIFAKITIGDNMQNLSRLELIINKEKIEKIKNKNILLIGLGGVGGYTFETLVRSGVENITIVDGDTFEQSNLNRQILSLNSTLNKNKTDVAEERAKDINPDIKIKKITKVLTKENINEINFKEYDYVIDACDTMAIKKELIKITVQNNIKFIASMGTGNKMKPELLKITTLDKTEYDPIAKILRKYVKEEKINKKITVVASTEKPKKTTTQTIGSNAFVPATAGLLLTSYVINDIVGEI